MCRVGLALLLLRFVPVLTAQQYPFLPVPGSPRGVQKIVEDATGLLWIAAGDDVFCFDGRLFFSLRSLGLPPIRAQALAVDGKSGVWIASETGLVHFHDGRTDRLLGGSYVADIVQVRPGVLLAAVILRPPSVVSQLYRVRENGGIWIAGQLADWKGSKYLTRDPNGEVAYACPQGWCELSGDAIVAWRPGYQGGPIIHKAPSDVMRVLRDRSGCAWFRTLEDVQFQCPGDPQPRQLSTAVAGHDLGAELQETAGGSMLLPGDSSLALGRPGSFRVATPENGLPSLNCATAASDGGIWLGGSGGLYRFAFPFRMEFWTEREGLPGPMCVLRTGGRVFAGTGRGISYLSPDRARWIAWQSSRDLGMVGSLLPAPGGNLYAAPYRGGIAEFSPAGNLVAESRGPRGAAAKFARTPDGQLWLSGAGVSQVVGEGRRLALKQEALPGDRILGSDIEFEARTGRLWACYAGGLIVREGGGWRFITTKDGLLENTCRSLAALPNGDVWLGYFRIPAFALVKPAGPDPVRVKQFRGGGEIGDARVFFLDTDSRGWLWRSSSDGIYVADPAQAEAGLWVHLKEPDGLPAGENGGNQQAFYSDPDGTVWWGADNTLTHFDPPPDLVHPMGHLAGHPTGTPAAFVSGFSLDGKPKLAGMVHDVPHGANLVAHVAFPHAEHRNELRVRYRLLPGQTSWREGRSLDLALEAPPWGSHTLELQSRYSTGPWSAVSRQAFAVLAPAWFSWPSFVVLAGMLAGAGAGRYSWQRKRTARAAKVLPDLAGWRLPALCPEVHELIGTTLDSRYEAGALVARGGFASVLKGRDLLGAGRPCAIKVFRHELRDREWLTRRFQQEVSALDQIHHPNVVRIYGHGITPAGGPYLVMEFIEGATLRDLLASGALPAARAGALLQQAADALHQIHARGICHRDLKPDNLMLRAAARPGEELVLIDFSIAIVRDPDETVHGLSRAAGTLEYMAPEQVIGFATPATDIYSLAKVVLEMLTGQRLSALLPDATLDLPARVRQLAGTLPFALTDEATALLGAALEFDPLRRPQHAREFAGPIARDLLNLPCGLSASPGPSPIGSESAES